MTALTVTLPWPDRRLWPNQAQYRHWRSREEPRDAAIAIGWALGRELGVTLPSEPTPIEYVFHGPTRRKYDLEGAHGACKHYIDGLARALEVDDFYFEPATQRRGEPVKGGCVEIRIGQ